MIPESPADNDPVEVITPDGILPTPSGRLLYFNGQVLNQEGCAIPGAVVELWSTDANGWYIDPDGGPFGVTPSDPQRDINFQGMGSVVASEHGAFSFRTIRPVPYPFAPDRFRASHLHVIVKVDGVIRLTTQIYFADELADWLRNDPIHGLLDSQDPENLDHIRPNLIDPVETIDREGNSVITGHLNLVISESSQVDSSYRCEVSDLDFDFPNRRVTMSLTPGKLVDVEMSLDLVSWVTVGQNQSVKFGMNFVDGFPQERLFYRARTLPLM